MAIINILPDEVANRIAAGEVVERPASVVKELVENSIDAGATKITVKIEKGGKQLIQVIDDGCGIDETDIYTAFERHATSKIKQVADIFSINTLGFRGEALPAIASVSALTIISKTAKAKTALSLNFNAGVLTNSKPIAANTGTVITVKKLFANIPARRKFLKSDQVEYKHIHNYIHYQSILHPEIEFNLISNDKQKLKYPVVEKIDDRLLAIFGSDLLNHDLIRIDNNADNMTITGYISGLEEEENQSLFDVRYIFVNGRFIKDKIILHALKQAYEPFLKLSRGFKAGKLPPYLLFINVNPELVDFNVHPAKLELRFRDSQSVHHFVKTVVYNALFAYEENKFSSIKQKLYVEPEKRDEKPISNYESKLFTYRTGIDAKPAEKNVLKEEPYVYQADFFEPDPPKELYVEEKKPKYNFSFVKEEDTVNPWQLHNSYILIQVEEGMMVIDQHAAHERVLYEKIMQRIEGENAPRQKLLFPTVIDIPPYITELMSELIEENQALFEKVGFKVKTFSGNSIVIEEIPQELPEWDDGQIFIEILRQLQLEFEQTEDFRDSIAKSVSCKAALKAGKPMTKKEMLVLINSLFGCQTPYFCPHGRPLIFKVTLTELEKRFKRIL